MAQVVESPAEIWIRPQVGSLKSVKGRVPTIRGFVDVEVNQIPGAIYLLNFAVPANTTARVVLPWQEGAELRIDGKKSKPVLEDGALLIESMSSGQHEVSWILESAKCKSVGKELQKESFVRGLLSWLPFL